MEAMIDYIEGRTVAVTLVRVEGQLILCLSAVHSCDIQYNRTDPPYRSLAPQKGEHPLSTVISHLRSYAPLLAFLNSTPHD